MAAIIVAVLTSVIGGFFGFASGYPGALTGGIAGLAAGSWYALKMRDIEGRDHFVARGMFLGAVCGLLSGSLAHIPRLILDALGVEVRDPGGGVFWFEGWNMVAIGAVFGVLVGFVWGLAVSVAMVVSRWFRR